MSPPPNLVVFLPAGNKACGLISRQSCAYLITLAAAALILSLYVWDEHLLDEPQQVVKDRVAICLVGGARRFELTGPSIQKHLLSAYPHSDVFVNVPLDENTHKLSLLAAQPRLARVRVFPQAPLRESGVPRKVLAAEGSPNGIQGLLQYFQMVEGCLPLVSSYASAHSLDYTWWLRTRVDGFWSAPPPPLHTLDLDSYTVPLGSQFRGFNDRLGIGGVATSQVALSRLSMLAELAALHKKTKLNSETAFAAQLAARNISVALAEFPFCIVTERLYPFSFHLRGLPVASLASRAPLNGAKCRPCTPRAVGQDAEAKLRKLDVKGSWPGVTSEIDLCDASKPWEAGWPGILAQVAGREAASTCHVITVRSFDECVADYGRLEGAEGYTGPSARLVCLLREWGAIGTLGSRGTTGSRKEPGWPAYFHPLTNQSVIFSLVGLAQGNSLTEREREEKWEEEVDRLVGCRVHRLELAIKGKGGGGPWRPHEGEKSRTAAEQRQAVLEREGDGASGSLGEIRYLNFGGVSSRTDHNNNSRNNNNSSREVPRGPLPQGLKAIAEGLGYGRVDLLKVDTGRSQLSELLDVSGANWISSIAICQLVVRLRNWRSSEDQELLSNPVVQQLQTMGFALVHCLGHYEREQCLLVHETACTKRKR